MEQAVDVLAAVTVSEAVDGMRRPFQRAFGRTWVARRLGRAAWSAFRVALLHECGIAVAASHAHVSAAERNVRIMPVARWSRSRVRHAVDRAVRAAANAG